MDMGSFLLKATFTPTRRLHLEASSLTNVELRGNKNCKANIKVLDGQTVGHLYQHTHALGLYGTDVVKVTAQIKAMDTEETPQQITAEAVTSMAASAAMQMPAVCTIRNVQ